MEPSDFTLLVVDDVAENREMLSRRLERKGFPVLVAEDGWGAIQAVRTQPVDLVLLDIMMPGMSGIEVLQELRKTYSSAELPIIMVTAKAESEDVVEALELGANDYVTKPIDFPIVLARVQSQLRTKQSRRLQAAAAAAQALSQGDIGPGFVLAGKYRLETKIGAGNFGAVYRAKHLELDHPVAVKLLQTSVGSGEDALARFRREGISACRVKHPNAVAVLDFGVTDDGVAFLVMELLEGESLLDALQRGGGMSAARCAELLVPVCEALAEAHDKGIIHRDIKPSNIFLQRTPKGVVAKVLDFGIAKIAGEQAMSQHLTVDGTILGTPAYMPPERFRSRAYDGKSDVYSLGITVYQLLDGRLPFMPQDGDPMSVAMMHLNAPPPPFHSPHLQGCGEVLAVVHRALSKEPEDRPSAAEFGQSLQQAVAAAGPAALVDPPPPAPAAVDPALPTIPTPLPEGTEAFSDPPTLRAPTGSTDDPADQG